MSSKSLNEVKTALFSKVMMKENKKFFVTKASLNAFTSKIFKVKSFKQVEELKRVFNYIKSNNLKYKNKELKQYIEKATPLNVRIQKLMTEIQNTIKIEKEKSIAPDVKTPKLITEIQNAFNKIKKEKKQLHKVVPFKELKQKVISWYNTQHAKTPTQNRVYRFKLRLKSGIRDIEHTFKFNHINHFINWFDKIYKNIGLMIVESGGEIMTEEGLEGIFTDFCSIVYIDFIRAGCNNHKSGEKKFKGCLYSFKLFNPTSDHNNCLFKALGHILEDKINIKQLRKQFNLPFNSKVSIDDAYKIIHHLNLDVQIIEADFNDELDTEKTYILLNNEHYYFIQSFELIQRKNIKTKRGLMAMDFETRKTEQFNVVQATGAKMYILKDTICHAYYKNYKSSEHKSIKFTTNKNKSSARQFIDFLNSEAKSNRSYNIIAHNGGNFDYYFIISQMTEAELLECELHFRGVTIIGINYRGNLFKDSCCFLTDSLQNLSNSYKVNQAKITEFELDGAKISSSNLCFYKPELTFNQFLDLEKSKPEFWKLYNEYCLYDCISLYQIWEKFIESIEYLIKEINPEIIRTCNVNACNTIGSLSKKIIQKLTETSESLKSLDEFLEVKRKYNTSTKKQEMNCNIENYKFLCNFKRGGISHCNKAGKHMSGITGVDIASQYPASLIYSKIPCGKSRLFEGDDVCSIKNSGYKYGFYLLSDVKFNGRKLKPVALSLEGQSLNWATNEMNELYVDSFMLAYLIKNCGLYSYTIKKALLSKKYIMGEKLFGSYINTFYDEKKRQDKLKADKDPEYNEALRSTIKLFLNSLTGKLVENPAIHFSTLFNENSSVKLNGLGIEKTCSDDRFNDWIVPGVMVYSYSKRLLFEYINCLPNGSDDVVHIETDGIYFSSRFKNDFIKNVDNYRGDYPVKMGEDLGNLKIEKSTKEGQVAYFLGKKFYCITTDKEPIMRIKGIPQKTIDEHGNKISLVDINLYNDVYNGKTIRREFFTLKKQLFVQKTNISQLKTSRRIKPNQEYFIFN